MPLTVPSVVGDKNANDRQMRDKKAHDTSSENKFYRPFEKGSGGLANGLEKEHYLDYEQHRLAVERSQLHHSERKHSGGLLENHHHATQHHYPGKNERDPSSVVSRKGSKVSSEHDGHPARFPSFGSKPPGDTTIKTENDSFSSSQRIDNDRLLLGQPAVPNVVRGSQKTEERTHSETTSQPPKSQDLAKKEHAAGVYNHLYKASYGNHVLLPEASSAVSSQPQPMVSKLDLEAQRRLSRLSTYSSDASDNDEMSDDDSEAEEYRHQRLLVIASGPPQKLDKSPRKIRFLKRYGLTTQARKEEMRYERRRKRRRLYREPSVSPVEITNEKQVEDPPKAPPPQSTLNPDDLNLAPDYKQKSRFLATMGLEPVTPDRRHRKYNCT